MLTFLSRKQASPPQPQCWMETALDGTPAAGSPSDPEGQVRLVSEAVEKLDAVRRMVAELADVPMGDRSELLGQLSSTVDRLQGLYFLDAIY